MWSWLILKLIHVVAGVFWAGAVVLVAGYVIPALRAAGPAGGVVMRDLTAVRKLPIAVNAAGLLTTLSGLLLYWRISDAFRNPLLDTPFARWLALGSVCGIAALLVGSLVQFPTAMRLGALTARFEGPPTPEQAVMIDRLQQRLHRGAIAAALLLGLSVVGMALCHPV